MILNGMGSTKVVWPCFVSFNSPLGSVQMTPTLDRDVGAHQHQQSAGEIRGLTRELAEAFYSIRGVVNTPRRERAGGDQRQRQPGALFDAPAISVRLWKRGCPRRPRFLRLAAALTAQIKARSRII